MSDEDIIKRRLLIDGDGTGDDRRLNMLLKQFLKWTYSKNDSPENNQIIYDRLLAQMAQCQFAGAKSEYTTKMIEQELKNYVKLSESIEKSIELAKQEIDDAKKQLIIAKEIRKNKMEYDILAKKIKEQPDREATNKQIETLKKDLAELMEKNMKLDRKVQKRRKDFTLLMYTIRELQTQLEDDDSDSDSSKSDNDYFIPGTMEVSDEEEENNDANVERKHKVIKLEMEVKKESKVEDEQLTKDTVIIDEDAVLELSIEKDEHDDKMDAITTN